MNDGTGIRLKISQGNSKIGKIPNLSLPPILTCRQDALCKVQCYAQKLYRMYPSVRGAWDHNLVLLQSEPAAFYHDLALYLALYKPERFRLHVAGDFINEDYFINLCEVFAAYPQTQVLTFTKRYDMPFDQVPDNLKIILSVWPGMELPDRDDLPWAWIDTDVRFPVQQTHIACVESCLECSHACWHGVSAELPVMFKVH